MFRNNDISDGGRAVLIEPPTDDVVTLADCKAMLGISGADQDLSIQAAIYAAVDNLDAASGWLGRALREQTWELQLRSFNDRRRKVAPYNNPLAIPLPYAPLLSIVSVKYFDVAGVDRTLVLGSDYRILGLGAPLERQAIAPVYQGNWPVARVDDASVRVRFACGYDEIQNIMPRQLTQAVCLAVRDLLPLMTRDQMLLEDRVEGVGSQRYQSNPEFAAVTRKAIAGLLSNLSLY
ncbi:putative phiE125 gp8 family phage protein [Bradyrhizobium sp. S3.9.2]|uniref:head-tail connector protein n=1 Tax=Bradyrhizobium sp. S3.9.2 TaxID=3156432 RepID=UPI00339213DD